MKAFAKSIIVMILSRQVRRLYKKTPELKVVAVTGSVGKTSTKLAISKILGQGYKIQYQDGNYNDIVTIPLIFFGQKTPSLFNPAAWLKLIISNELKLQKKYPFDIVVVELGTDGPEQLKKLNKFLQVEIGVLTAITPEHMEYFKTLDAVAKEELEIFSFSKLVIANTDMIEARYLKGLNYLSYALEQDADYQLKNLSFDDEGSSFDIFAGDEKIFSGNHEAIAEPLLYAILAAIAVAKKIGLNKDQIDKGIKSIKSASGRMQILKGINNSTIIDDTYNASPEAVRAALKTLYRIKAPQKIALLGNMNELGDFSESAHTEIGKFCDPAKLALVVTIGPDANNYLASAAKSNGCQVVEFDDPKKIAEYLRDKIQPGALILAKGSQNKVYAEEAVKALLANPDDAKNLVRQSEYWLKRKEKAFVK